MCDFFLALYEAWFQAEDVVSRTCDRGDRGYVGYVAIHLHIIRWCLSRIEIKIGFGSRWTSCRRSSRERAMPVFGYPVWCFGVPSLHQGRLSFLLRSHPALNHFNQRLHGVCSFVITSAVYLCRLKYPRAFITGMPVRVSELKLSYVSLVGQ
jgi:hypothetical protein